MRLEHYLTEAVIDATIEQAKEACSAYIQLYKWEDPDKIFNGLTATPVPFFRGVHVTEDTQDKFTRSPRTDRKPLDTPKDIHALSDDWFFEEFGWKVRSEGLFVSPNPNVGKAYARNNQWVQVYMIFPKTPFKYIWSPKVEDFYSDMVTSQITSDYRRGRITLEDFYQHLRGLGYTDKNIKQIDMNDPPEVMVKCSMYTAINFVYYPWYCERFKYKPVPLAMNGIYNYTHPYKQALKLSKEPFPSLED